MDFLDIYNDDVRIFYGWIAEKDLYPFGYHASLFLMFIMVASTWYIFKKEN